MYEQGQGSTNSLALLLSWWKEKKSARCSSASKEKSEKFLLSQGRRWERRGAFPSIAFCLEVFGKQQEPFAASQSFPNISKEDIMSPPPTDHISRVHLFSLFSIQEKHKSFFPWCTRYIMHLVHHESATSCGEAYPKFVNCCLGLCVWRRKEKLAE